MAAIPQYMSERDVTGGFPGYRLYVLTPLSRSLLVVTRTRIPG